MSNIYFKNIKIENFLSYEHAELSLNTPGYIFVNGENNNPDDAAKSNGCGKSTLFNAIVWALTGHTVSGVKDVANIYTEGTTSAELEFECDSKNYKVIRTKNPSNLKIYINDEDKSGKGVRDSEKLLAEYLPEITDYLLNSVIILGQGLPQRFTNNTPSGRKEVLEVLCKSDFMIEDLKKRLTERKEYLSNSLREKQDTKLQNETTISNLTDRLEKDKSELLKLPTINILKAEIEDLSNESADVLNKKSQVLCDIENLIDLTGSIDEKLLQLDLQRQQDIDNLELKDTKDLEETISNLKTEINVKTSKINELDAVSDVCPTCGQKLPDVHKIDTTELKHELENLNQQLNTHSQSLDDIYLETNSLLGDIDTKYEELKKDLWEELQSNKLALTELRQKQSDIEEEYKSITHDLSTKQSQLDVLQLTQAQLVSNINDTSETIDKLNDDNIVINNEIDTINKHLDINSKMNTIVKRDFRGYLLSNVIDYISNKCSIYSKQVFGVDKLLFALNGNNISISYDGKEYECLSGGEKQKVDVILQLSLRDMLCSYLNFSSNILVLDEITDSLDSIGAQKIFDLISNNLSDVETIYIISHHTDFSIPYDDEIHIVKGEDKLSRII